MTQTMHAIRVESAGGPEVLRYAEVPIPEPKPGHAIVKLEAIGVNFIDVYQRTGAYSIPLPFTPGMEGAGTVSAAGDVATGVRVGDRVAYQGVRGGYAEYASVPVDQLVALPVGVTAKQGAAVMLQGMTAHYLATSTYPLQRNDWCLIHAAAGGVGLLLCQIAKLRGARVIGTVSTDEKAQLARNAGADEVIKYTEEDFEAAVKRITRGAGVRVVYDSVGKTTFDKSLNCLAMRGMMVLFGQSSGAVPPIDLQVLNRKGSLFVTRPTLFAYVATRDELLHRANEVLGWVADGTLQVRVGSEYPLAGASDAHRALEGRKTTGKVLLIP